MIIICFLLIILLFEIIWKPRFDIIDTDEGRYLIVWYSISEDRREYKILLKLN